MSTHRITVTVNATRHDLEVPARLTLADLLRDRLDLTGTHLACEHGVCGACTVLVDGEPARSCLLLAVQADGASITTVEGIAPPGELGPVQRALHECHGLQCGFCTPGIVISATALLERSPSPTREEVVDMLGGHVCRCTGYQKIVESIERAAELAAEGPR